MLPKLSRAIKELAIEENCLMIEVLEKALENYKTTSQNYTRKRANNHKQ